MSQDPFSQNPYSTDFYNPQTQPASPQGSGENPLKLPGIFLIVISILGLIYCIVNTAITAPGGPPPVPPNAPPGAEAGGIIGFYGALVLMPLFAIAVLIGGICMVRLRGYAMAFAGAIVGLVPCCGPCLFLAIPFSIWALVLLVRPENKALFR